MAILMKLLVAFTFGVVLPVSGQFVQQGSKIVGSGAVGMSEQGHAAALSADGNTAIVGGWGDNGQSGAAWVFTRTNGTWTQQGSKLVGTGATGPARQGFAVALSADGNTALVGGPRDNTDTGAAWVFTRQGGAWTQQGSKLIGTGAVGIAREGTSVALSGDGNTALIGGSGDNGNLGAAWVFTRTNGTWTQQGSKLVGVGTQGPSVFWGNSVALSQDGNTALFGGSGDNADFGGVWVLTRDASGQWNQQGVKLVGTGAVGSAHQGYRVALSGDGNTAVWGGYADNNDAGAMWVFTRRGGVWTQQGNKVVGAGAVGSATQGASVALSADGTTAAAGGFFDNGGDGDVWVWTSNDSGATWKPGPKLLGTGATPLAGQGEAVSLSADGHTLLEGASGDNNQTGGVWVWTNPTPPPPSISSVVNAATFEPRIGANSWITITGTNLSTTTDTWDKNIVNGVLPFLLAGTGVKVDNKPAYIQYVSSQQINAIAPDLGTGPVSVTVSNANGTSQPVSVMSQGVMPGFFLWTGKYAVATRPDYSWAVKDGTFAGVKTTPSKPGEVIILWGTGFGQTIPGFPIGMQVPFDKVYGAASLPSVTVGNLPALVYGTALTPGLAGLYQVAIQIPMGAPDGDLPVVATTGGVQSPNTTVLTVQH